MNAGAMKWLRSIPLHIVVITIALVWMLPSVGLLVSSFRPPDDVTGSGWWTVFQTPFEFTQYSVENYNSVLVGNGLFQAFINSLTIVIPGTLIPIFVAAFAAYAFAWMEFPGRQIIFVIVVGLLVVPLQMTLIPVLKIYNVVGLTTIGTVRVLGIEFNLAFLGVWLAHTGYGLPFAVYLLRNFFGGLPKELFESAYLDGASPLTAFFRLALPLSVPALASLAIFQFLWTWNDLLVALIYLGGTADVAPLTVTVANMVASLGQNWHLLTAAAFITMALPLVVFFSLQRYFVRGILAGSVKG